MKRIETNIHKNIYVTSSDLKETKDLNRDNYIKIETRKITRYIGMGGAITEAASYNYSHLSKKNKQRLLNDYYSKEGLNYNFGRVVIGSSDFSLSHHEYALKKDLSDFSIKYDKEYIIPFLQDILTIKKIHLIAAPWSPPKMYKKLPLFNYGIKLKKKYYELYSLYLKMWLDAYKKHGLDIEYISMQNEPQAKQKWESCVYSLDEQHDFIYNYLLPKLKNTKVILWDHNKEDLYNVYKKLYCDNRHIAGIGFHYYGGPYFENIRKVREEDLDTLLINTESCCGYSEYNEIEWVKDAEIYLNDIIGDFNAGANAYLDWNILLDKTGGPCHVKNPVKSPMIAISDSYIKTPIYYYLYHVSHFIDEGFNIMMSFTNTDLKVISFSNDTTFVITIMNNLDCDYRYHLLIDGKIFDDSIEKHSIVTYLYTK